MDEKTAKPRYTAKNHSSFRLLIEDRDEIESFQGYLKVFDPVGLQFLQLWLTLRGYEKEYHRRLAELDQPNRHITDFIKWNIKCAKALIDKYFRQTRNDSRPAQVQHFQYEVELHIQQTKATPSIDTIAQLQNSLKNLLSVLQTLLEVIQFKAFCEHNQSTTKEIAAIKQISKKATAKYLPRLPENEIIQLRQDNKSPSLAELSEVETFQVPTGSNIDSENASFSDTTETYSLTMDLSDRRHTKLKENQIKRHHLSRNKSGLIYVPLRREIDLIESELATKNPKKFAAKLIAGLKEYLDELNQKTTTVSTHSTSISAPKVQPKVRPNPIKEFHDVDSKVGDWLERNHTSSPTTRHLSANGTCLQAEVRVLTSLPTQAKVQPTVSSQIRPQINIGSSVLSSDSGLSSTRIESEATDSEILEMNGLKRLLIQDIEHDNEFTKIIYHYQKEKFVVRVAGRNPTLAQFRIKFHDQQYCGSLRFFFKTSKEKWLEISDDSNSLPVENQLVEARILKNQLA